MISYPPPESCDAKDMRLLLSSPLPELSDAEELRRDRIYRLTQLAVYNLIMSRWEPHRVAEVVEQQMEGSDLSPLSCSENAVVSRWAEGLMRMVVPGVFEIKDPYYLKGDST